MLCGSILGQMFKYLAKVVVLILLMLWVPLKIINFTIYKNTIFRG